MVSASSLLIQSGIATTLCNLDSDSRDEFSPTERTEGWTEVFGDNNTIEALEEEHWRVERDYADCVSSSLTDASLLFPEIPVVLVQYRPAWLEQLVLRVAGIPHVVLNSSYASNELTGPLPYLRDLGHQPSTATSSSSSSSSPPIPVLVGRRHPKLCFSKFGENSDDGDDLSFANNGHERDFGGERQGNTILEYLKSQRGVDLDAHLKSSEADTTINSKQALSKLLSLLITTKLRTSLMVLRYEDRNVWENVYRKQCLSSSRSRTSKGISISSGLPTMRGLYQAWSERVMARKALRVGGSGAGASVDEARMAARQAYEILEHQLGQRENDSRYLLGTAQPSMVDAILWAHLAEALCDVHLVVILADFPLLVKYFQFVYDTYFLTAPTSENSPESEKWKVWNKHQNLVNPFQQVPLESDVQQEEEKTKLKHALDLMQALSVQEHDLLELLQVGKEVRSQELNHRQSPKRVNMATSSGDEGVKEPEMLALENARRQQQRHDQHWISLVTGVALLAGISSMARMLEE